MPSLLFTLPPTGVDMDYTDWVPHMDNSNDPEFQGCLLGVKDKFKRLKKDSWCKNGHAFEVKGSKKSTQCRCTKDDYEW